MHHVDMAQRVARARLPEHCMRTHLVLNEELDTLDRCGSGLRDGGRYTTHYSSSSDMFARVNPSSPNLIKLCILMLVILSS